MRLVCPNCDAEYEVDASAIPDTGRDVQCSNCGHGWFQMSPAVEDQMAAEAALFDPPPAETDQDAYEDAGDLGAEPVATAGLRKLDESVLAVLREEAERETSARRFEPPPIEMQPEFGLNNFGQNDAVETEPEPDLSAAVAATIAAANDGPGEDATDPVAQRIARMKGIDPTPAKPQSRREMLPEIDEINTTLRASSERRGGEAGAVAASLPTPRASAFRTGFVVMILVALGIVALYVMAPKLSEQIPAAKGALDSYVAAVDAGRLWLDGTLRAATGALGGKTP